MPDTGVDRGARRLLFVCTGNTCRSPLAEALARRAASARGLDGVEVRSAGIHASPGAPASEGSAAVAAEVGIDLDGHGSTPLDEARLRWADLVLCMGVSHRLAAERMGAGERAVLLTRFLPEGHPEHGRSVVDPVGREPEVYREVRELLAAAVDGLMDRLERSARDDASGSEG